MDLKEKIKKSGIYTRYYLSYFLNHPFVYPKEVNFQMTNSCTLKCKMCNIWKLPKKGSEISLGEMKEILNQIKSWDNTRYVSFVGGESLMRIDDTIELIKYASSLGFHTNLVSNATLMNYRVCKELIEAGLERIALSLDGVKKETHDFIRGKGNFNKIVKTAKIFLALKKHYNVKVDFNTVVMSYNFREMPDIYWLAKKIGVDQWFVQSVVLDNTFHKFDYDSSLWIRGKDLEELKKVIAKLIMLKLKDKKFIYNSIDYLKAIPQYFEQKKDFKLGRCMAGFYSLNIDPYGVISICNYGPNIRVQRKNVSEIWKDSRFKQTRTLIKECSMPCMMLCYQRFSIPELVKNFFYGE